MLSILNEIDPCFVASVVCFVWDTKPNFPIVYDPCWKGPRHNWRVQWLWGCILPILINLIETTGAHVLDAIAFHGQPVITSSQILLTKESPLLWAPTNPSCNSCISWVASATSTHRSRVVASVLLYKVSPLRKNWPTTRLMNLFSLSVAPSRYSNFWMYF